MYKLFNEKEIKNYEDIHLQLSEIEKCITEYPSYSLKGLTFKKFKREFGEEHNMPISGLYVVTDSSDQIVWINHSDWLAKDIGENLRQLSLKKAPLTFRIAEQLNIKPIDAKNFIENNFNNRFIIIKNVHLRAVSEIYLEVNYKAQFSNFDIH